MRAAGSHSTDSGAGSAATSGAADKTAAASWLRGFVLLTCLFLGGIALINWCLDPLACRDKSLAYVDLMYDDSPEFVKARFDSDRYDLALLGSSRLFRVDPWFLDSLTGKYSVNLAVAGAPFSLNVMLLQRLKQRGTAVLCGFDCFTMNLQREDYTEQAAKLRRFSQVFENPAWADFMTIRLLNYETLRQSARIVYRQMIDKQAGSKIAAWNAETSSMNVHLIPESFLPTAGNKFSNYQMYPDSLLLHFAQLFEEGDIIMIPAKYHRWYDYFDDYGVSEQYFDAIELLVKNTRAEVYSFYGRSELTRDTSNFDEHGWHYKPKVARRMLLKMFADKQQQFGERLTPANVSSYLNEMRRRRAEYASARE